MKNLLESNTWLYLTILTLISLSCNEDPSTTPSPPPPPPLPPALDKVEEFRFLSSGKSWDAKIWIPAEYQTNSDLPSIYLVDDEEIHYPVATDEFEKVIEGVNKVSGLDALVITVEGLDPDLGVVFGFQEFYTIYIDLVSYVETNYTDNPSRTLIGRGSAANFVLGTLYLEEQETAVFQNFVATTSSSLGYFNEIMKKEEFPKEKDNKKLHFSFDGESNYDLNMRFINTLNEKTYPWLEFDWAEYPNLMFTTSYPSAYADGIKYIFEE